jgi:membrane protein implicated in regulation of membrane protease activity
VGIVYLAALIFGAGTILLQLVLSGSGDADAADGSEIDTTADADASSDGAESGADGEHAGHGGHGHAADGAILPLFLSLRFWVYLALTFGLVGTLLTYLDLAGRITTLFLSLGTGLLTGFAASFIFSALLRNDLSSGAGGNEALGQVGRVLIPCARGRRGKVRLELRGQTLDFLATTDEESLEQGALVLVEEVRGDAVHVSRVPPDFLPPPSDLPRLSS